MIISIDQAVRLCDNRRLLPLLHQFWWRSYFEGRTQFAVKATVREKEDGSER